MGLFNSNLWSSASSHTVEAQCSWLRCSLAGIDVRLGVGQPAPEGRGRTIGGRASRSFNNRSGQCSDDDRTS